MRKFGLALAFAVGLIMSVTGAANAATIQNLGTLDSAHTTVDFASVKLDGAGKGQFVYNFTIAGGASETDGSITSSSTLGVQSLKTFTFSLYSGIFGGANTLLKTVTQADAFVTPSGSTSVDLDFANFLAAGKYFLLLDVTSGKKFANVSGNLTIAPVPVPAALPMFGAVLVGLVAFQSRRRNRLSA